MEVEPTNGQDELFTAVYGELRRIARRKRRAAGAAAVLDTTTIVHEVYLKLHGLDRTAPLGREHFLSLAARAMRQVLVDHARGRGRLKRGADWIVTGLSEQAGVDGEVVDFVALDAALEHLASLDARAAQVVEWHVFGGLGIDEIAAIRGVAERTVFRDWRRARAFLVRELDLRVQAP